MSLLELEQVGKRYGSGAQERVVLNDVSLQVDAGELVAIWGRRRSGRSTLLRVAAGIEAPDSGVVRLHGRPLTARSTEALDRICFCRKTFRPSEGQLVLDQLLIGQLSRGVLPALARSRARDALKRAGVGECAALRICDLDAAQGVRVAIARALTRKPGMLVIDEPTLGVEPLDRDGVLLLLRSLADEGIAVLASAAETTGLSGADRALSLGDGQLLGSTSAHRAPVIPLRASA